MTATPHPLKRQTGNRGALSRGKFLVVKSVSGAPPPARAGRATLRLTPRSRSALAITNTDDSDMATAATSGVTWPSTATGTATVL